MSRRKCDACGRMANKHKRRMILAPDGTMTPGLRLQPLRVRSVHPDRPDVPRDPVLTLCGR